MVLTAGAMLRYAGSFPFHFPPFALAVSAAGLVSCFLLIGSVHGADLRRFAWMQVCLDVALVTGIIAASGGSESVFSFLYVLTVLEGCFLLGRRGGLVAASLEDQRKDFSDLQAFRDLVFQSVGSGLIAVNPYGRITAFNRAAESITGVAEKEALGQPWEALFGREVDLEEARQAVAGPGGQSRRYEIRLHRHDGYEVPVGVSFWSLRSGDGEVVGLIGVCQDLSSIKRMEQRMRQADRLATIGRLSANIAHEIRNPLASISGAIEALVREL